MAKKTFMVASLCLALALAGLLFFDSVAEAANPKISWSQKKVDATIAPGSTFTATVTFTSTQNLSNAIFWWTPSVGNVLTVTPASVANVLANTGTTITLTVTIPANTSRANYDGELKVVAGSQKLDKPLELRFKVARPRITWTPSKVETTLDPGATYSTTVTFASSDDLSNATLWWSPSIGNVMTVQPLTFSTITANVLNTVALTVTIPANTPRNDYSGELRVTVGGNKLSDPLHLKFKVSKTKILWVPSAVYTTLAPGGMYSTTVNFTSSKDLTNVTFWASPSISSVLTITPTAFAAITANTLYPLTVMVTIPANTRRHNYDGELKVQVGGIRFGDPLHLHIKVQ